MKVNPIEWFNSTKDRAQLPRQLLFQSLVLEYNAMPTSARRDSDAGLHQNMKLLIEQGQRRRLSWLELYDFEAMLIRLRDDAGVRRAAWSIRAEFKKLASDDLVAQYDASNPPDITLPTTPADLVRRDVEDLLGKLHELRLGRSKLDLIRAYTTAVSIVVCVVLLIVLFVTAYIKNEHDWRPDFSVIAITAMAGVFGASFSMLIRLGQLPTKGDLVPRYPGGGRLLIWIVNPFLSLVEGMFGAIILYFIFRAGLMKGALFPDFSKDFPSARPGVALLAGRLPDMVEAAKLGVWCFLAGFSERLVPDVLTRLTEQAQSTAAAPVKGTPP